MEKYLSLTLIYSGLLGINAFKVYFPNNFDATTGKWKWYINLPNIRLKENEKVNELLYKKYIYKMTFLILSLYYAILAIVNVVWGLNTINTLVLLGCMIIDFIYFMHIRSKAKFIHNK